MSQGFQYHSSNPERVPGHAFALTSCPSGSPGGKAPVRYWHRHGLRLGLVLLLPALLLLPILLLLPPPLLPLLLLPPDMLLRTGGLLVLLRMQTFDAEALLLTLTKKGSALRSFIARV
jgi:hypothetical protein